MATGDVVQARIIGTLHTQTVLNQFYYTAQSGPGNVVPFLDRFRVACANPLLPLVSSEYNMTRIEGQRVSPRPLTFLASVAVAQPGTVAGVSVPSSVALTISKHTQFAGRKYRGRWYIPGLPAADQSFSTVLTAKMTQWQTYANLLDDLLTDADGTVWAPVLSHGYIPNTEVLGFTVITSCIANQILRNQRRRQVGRGK